MLEVVLREASRGVVEEVLQGFGGRVCGGRLSGVEERERRGVPPRGDL